MKKCYSIIFILLLSASLASANPDSINTKFGIYGGINLNSHTADFYKLKGIPNCCPNFESGDGIGFNAGLLIEYKLINDLWLGGRLGIMTLDGVLTKEEATMIILETGPAEGKFEHKITGSFFNLGFEPTVIYNPFGGLLFSAGARFGLNMTKNYEQVETITEPAGFGTFIDSLGNDTRSRTRNDLSGDIPDAISFQIALLGTISYELPLNRDGSLLLAPELSYYFPVSELVENTNWKVTSLRAGIAIKYSPIPKPPKEEIFRQEYHIDTISIESEIITENTFKSGVENIYTSENKTDREIITTETIRRTDTLFYPQKYKLDGTITAVGVDSSENEIENPVFVIEEFISNRLDPLLNYIFFADNSSKLPDRYIPLTKNETQHFQIDSMYRNNTLEIYYNILNIICERLTLYPDSKITLIGCNSGIGDEKNNKGLSQNRAETVRNYLVDIWSISSDRITLNTRNLPEKASTPIQETDKEQENRRVEIYSDNYKILEPVFIEKIDRSANPPIARFKLKANAEAGLSNWKLEAYQSDSPGDKFVKSGKETVPESIDWKLEDFQKIIPKTALPIKYKLELEDKKGNPKTIPNKTLPIDVITVQEKRKERIGDYEIERFSLILFDFDKAAIEGNNKNIIDFISSRIKPESEIEIYGYTDRTGDDEYNLKLSENRARATKRSLGLKDAVSQGIGEQKLLYDNELPEGRFYCRTVQIEVKTNVK